MAKYQTIRFTDEAQAKVEAAVEAEGITFNKVVTNACEGLPTPKAKPKAKKKE